MVWKHKQAVLIVQEDNRPTDLTALEQQPSEARGGVAFDLYGILKKQACKLVPMELPLWW